MNIKDLRPWYEKGKVLEIAEICKSSGDHYRHPVRPWTGSEWDNSVARGLMSQGYTVVITDYGYKYDIPSVYNDIPVCGEQLELF